MTEAEAKTNESETVQSAETPQAAEALVEVEATAENAEEAHSLLHRIKEAGEIGRKEWEQTLTKAREFLSKARADHAAGEGTHWERFQRETGVMFGRAQDRGADLLLSLISQVRKGAQTLEENVRQARERVASEVSADAPEASVAA